MKNKNRKWTTRDGTKIRLRDMDDSHLMNAYRMVERSNAYNVNRMFHYGRTAFEFEGIREIQIVCYLAVNKMFDNISPWEDRFLQELTRRGWTVEGEEFHSKKGLLRSIDSLIGPQGQRLPKEPHF